MSYIKFSHVSFSYGENTVLSDVSVSFESAGLYLILGRSGSGKTTFLSLMSSLLKPDSGTIDFQLSGKPSMVYQSPLLLDYLTVEENVSLPLVLDGETKKEANRKADEMLEKVHISELKDRNPKTLSGGEQMRVSIARALVREGDCLILDEPTGQLDEKNSAEIYKLLKELSKDRMVILVTHDEKNAYEIADCLYELKDKKLVLIQKRQETNNKLVCTGNQHKARGKIQLKESIDISWKFLAKRKARVILCSLFIAISLAVMYLGLNVSDQAPAALSELISSFFDYSSVTVSMKESVYTTGTISLERSTLPDDSVLRNLGVEKSYPCLSYFIPESYSYVLNGTENSFALLSSFEDTSDKISSGRIYSSYNEAVVNKAFLDTFSFDEESVIGRTVYVSYSSVVQPSYFESSDIIQTNIRFKIVGVTEEISAFNSACMYYSYPMMYSYFDTVMLDDIAEENDGDLSVIDLFDYASPNDDFTSQKVLVECGDPSSLIEKSSLLYGEDVEIYSRGEEIKESFDELLDSLVEVVMIFLLLSSISAFILEFLSVYSLYEENIRLFALAYVSENGKKNKQLLSSGLLIILFTLTLLLFVLISFVATFAINTALNVNSYPSFLSTLHLPGLLIGALLALLSAFVASYFPLRRIKDKDIKKELEGEE